MASTLIQLGITDRQALAAARRLAGGEAALTDAIVRGASGVLPTGAPVVLSTCERIEVYAIARPDVGGRIAGVLAGCLSGQGGRPAFERRVGEAAVAHLFAVAAGLESRLVGEPHILGQVSRAGPRSGAGDASGSLSRLFQDAVACGRRARAISGLDRLAVSCVDLAVGHARRLVPAGERAAVVGSGTIAREMALRLAALGFVVTVFARHHERAAENLPADVRTSSLDALREGVASAGLLVAATSSAAPVVSSAHLGSRNGPLVVIDLGMPPNIDADVRLLAAARVVTLDDLLEGQQRPHEVMAQARAVVNARASRWSRRWLGAGVVESAAALHRSTVA